MAASQIV